MHSQRYTLIFGTVLSLVCAVILTLVCTQLKALKERNEQARKQRGILAVLRVGVPAGAPAAEVTRIINGKSAAEIERLFQEEVRSENFRLPGWGEKPFPVYSYPAKDPRPARAFHLQGDGLWGPIKGVLALEPDGETIRGIRILSHSETPGLGSRIEELWWIAKWEGKKIRNTRTGNWEIQIVKPGGGREREAWQVDGITAATMTGDALGRLTNAAIADFRRAMAQAEKGGP